MAVDEGEPGGHLLTHCIRDGVLEVVRFDVANAWMFEFGVGDTGFEMAFCVVREN